MRKTILLSSCLVIFLVAASFFIQTVFAAAGTDTLEGYWKLDETSSGGSDSIVDSSGDSASGTPSGAGGTNNKPQPSTDVPSGMNFPDSRSLNFDGTDDQVQISGLLGSPTNITITGWAKVTSGASQGEIISLGDHVLLRLGGSNILAAYYTGSSHTTIQVNTNYSGSWHHFAFVFDDTNNTQTVYADGAVIGTPGSYAGSISYSGLGSNTFIGQHGNAGSYPFNGYLDDVRVYSRALSSTEITALANKNHTSAIWDGSSSTDYEIAANWDINAIPDQYTLITIADVTNQASATANLSLAGLTINSGAWFDLAGFNLTVNDSSATSGLATNSGTLRLNNTQTITNFVNDTDSGTVMINPSTTSTTGLKTGNSYYNLILNDGLFGYWKFDETSGTDAVDSSGYQNTGTHINTPTISTTVPSTNFINTRSLQFANGSSQYVNINTTSSVLTTLSQAAVAFWFRKTTVGDTPDFFFSAGDGSSNNICWLRYSNSTTFQVLSRAGGVDNYRGTFTAPNDTNWHHVAYVVSSSGNKVYLDGVDQSITYSAGNASSTGFCPSVSSASIAQDVRGGNYLLGYLDDFRMYRRALSAIEVGELTGGKMPRTSWTTTTLGAVLDVNGDLVLNSGTLDVDTSNSYQVNVAGNFENNGGVFTPRSGTVVLDGTDQAITAGGTFYNLTKSVSVARTLTFGQNSISTTSGTMTLTGQSGALLTLASAVSGTQTMIDPQGTRDITYVSVADNNNIDDTAIAYSSTNTLGSNLTNWATPTNTPTPTPTSAPTSSASVAGSSTSSSSAPSCSKSVPSGTPGLYQITTGLNSVVLYFTPVSGSDSYYISYGTNSSVNQFATSFSSSEMSGVIAFTINSLQAGTTYYFKVRGGNGCATGNWSSVLSATTDGVDYGQLLTYPDIPKTTIDTVKKVIEQSKKLEITSSKVTEQKSNVCSYTVQSGDNLWSIAQDKLGNGTQYTVLQELNKITNLRPGQEIKLPCDKDAIAKAKEEVKKTGISLDVKVLASNNNPVVGATVTLHSKVQVAKTDKDGIARFENVEKGEHKVVLAYNGYNGEEKLTVDGSKKEQTLTLQVNMQGGFTSPTVLFVIGILVFMNIFLMFLLIRKQKRHH